VVIFYFFHIEKGFIELNPFFCGVFYSFYGVLYNKTNKIIYIDKKKQLIKMSIRIFYSGSTDFHLFIDKDGLVENDIYKFELVGDTTEYTFLKDSSRYVDTYSTFTISTLSTGGIDWVETREDERYNNVVLSSTGQYQTTSIRGGYVIISSDYGLTWKDVGTEQMWHNVDMTDSASIQVAVGWEGDIYMSTNYGEDWVGLTGVDRNYTNVAISGLDREIGVDMYILACDSEGFVYRSTDGGYSFDPILTEQWWKSVSISTTGQYQIALALGEHIYTSNTYGETWNRWDIDGYWFASSISSTGQYQVIGEWDGILKVSNDYGETWTDINITQRWNNISMSEDGKYMYATSYGINPGHYIYYSNDYGVTWIADTLQHNWHGIGCSGDGLILTSTSWEGPLYTSTRDVININEGWYKYNLYKEDELLKTGQCYVFDDEDNVENSPTDTSYGDTKTTYVYKK